MAGIDDVRARLLGYVLGGEADDTERVQKYIARLQTLGMEPADLEAYDEERREFRPTPASRILEYVLERDDLVTYAMVRRLIGDSRMGRQQGEAYRRTVMLAQGASLAEPDFDDLARRLVDYRRKYLTVSAMHGAAERLQYDDIDEAVTSLRESLDFVASRQGDPFGAFRVQDVASDVWDEYRGLLEDPSKLITVATGLNEYDDRSGGMRFGEGALVLGEPSTGKSLLLQHMATTQYRMDPRFDVVVVNAEMSEEDLLMRLFCSELARRVDGRGRDLHTMLRNFALPEEDWPELAAAVKAFCERENAMWVIPRGKCRSLGVIRGELRKISAERKVALVVVDYLDLLAKFEDPGGDEWGSISRVCAEVYSWAAEFECVVVGAKAQNRRNGKRGIGLDLIRGSAMPGYDFDHVLHVDKDDEEETKRWINVLKGRNCPADYSFPVIFDGSRMQIHNQPLSVTGKDGSEVDGDDGDLDPWADLEWDEND